MLCPSAVIGCAIAAVWLSGAALAGAWDDGPGGGPADDGQAVSVDGPDSVGLIEAPDDAGPARSDMSSGGGQYEQSDAPVGFGFADGSVAAAARPPASDIRVRGQVPVVVELFTAQGCSTCPAADALIAALADRPDVLVLGWHVDYWDYLGWADSYAQPAHTKRQRQYAAAAGERGIYTPQILVDGTDTLIGADGAALDALIDDHARRPPAIMATSVGQDRGFAVDLMPRASVPGGVQVSLIRYLPTREVAIDSGENRGREAVYRNIVVGARPIIHWPARKPLRLTLRVDNDGDADDPPDTRHAVILQQSLGRGRPGPILAAVRLD